MRLCKQNFINFKVKIKTYGFRYDHVYSTNKIQTDYP